MDDIKNKAKKGLSVNEFELIKAETNALIIDTRNAKNFGEGFIPDSINIGIDGDFAVWVGTIIVDLKQKLVVIAEPNRIDEVITRLLRVGFDQVMGYLDGGIEAWKNAGKELYQIKSVTPIQLASIMQNNPDTLLLDVRKASEYNSQHVVSAINTPLDYYKNFLAQIDKNKTYYVYCAGGYRSMIFISLLHRLGYRNLINVYGGFNEIIKTEKFNITDYVCPTTLL
jgi:rhodanese-related sulfurtransferase